MNAERSIRIGQELREWMASRGLTEAGLARGLSKNAEGVRVSQSWISRICTGEFKRLSGKTGRVLRYANIRIPSSDVDEEGTKILAAAVDDAWDGTLQGARALAGLLRGAAALARAARR